MMEMGIMGGPSGKGKTERETKVAPKAAPRRERKKPLLRGPILMAIE